MSTNVWVGTIAQQDSPYLLRMHYLVKTHNNNTVLIVPPLKTEKESGNCINKILPSVFHVKKEKANSNKQKTRSKLKEEREYCVQRLICSLASGE